MANHLKVAQQHAKKIDYYYEHAGTAGYAQAIRHQLEIESLLALASQSARGKKDVPVFQAFLEGVAPKMEEMKGRQGEAQ